MCSPACKYVLGWDCPCVCVFQVESAERCILPISSTQLARRASIKADLSVSSLFHGLNATTGTDIVGIRMRTALLLR